MYEKQRTKIFPWSSAITSDKDKAFLAKREMYPNQVPYSVFAGAREAGYLQGRGFSIATLFEFSYSSTEAECRGEVFPSWWESLNKERTIWPVNFLIKL